MANKTIKHKFKELYDRYQENLSNETREILESLYSLDGKSLHVFKSALSDMLYAEADSILEECEQKFSPSLLIEHGYDDIAKNYASALIIAQDDIDKILKTEGFAISKDLDYGNPDSVFVSWTVQKYQSAINNVKNQLKITGEVIDFFLKILSY